MFYAVDILSKRKDGLAIVWIAATLGPKSGAKKLSKKDYLSVDVSKACDMIVTPPRPLALRLSSNLLMGVARVYDQQWTYYHSDVNTMILNMKRIFFNLESQEAADMLVTGAVAKKDAITLRDDIGESPSIPFRLTDFSFALTSPTSNNLTITPPKMADMLNLSPVPGQDMLSPAFLQTPSKSHLQVPLNAITLTEQPMEFSNFEDMYDGGGFGADYDEQFAADLPLGPSVPSQLPNMIQGNEESLNETVFSLRKKRKYRHLIDENTQLNKKEVMMLLDHPQSLLANTTTLVLTDKETRSRLMKALLDPIYEGGLSEDSYVAQLWKRGNPLYNLLVQKNGIHSKKRRFQDPTTNVLSGTEMEEGDGGDFHQDAHDMDWPSIEMARRQSDSSVWRPEDVNGNVDGSHRRSSSLGPGMTSLNMSNDGRMSLPFSEHSMWDFDSTEADRPGGSSLTPRKMGVLEERDLVEFIQLCETIVRSSPSRGQTQSKVFQFTDVLGKTANKGEVAKKFNLLLSATSQNYTQVKQVTPYGQIAVKMIKV